MRPPLLSFRGTSTWSRVPSAVAEFFRDLPILLAGLSLFYVLLALTHYWLAPPSPQTHIRLDPAALPQYAVFSLLRISIAYAISLVFTFIYGYVAAYNARAERFLIPLLDTLQSIPVLSFLPGVMLAMISLFPRRQLGIELGSILLIFTGQVWNMTFSFYSSLKNIPEDMREVARLYRWSWWQRFTQLELPFSAIGLIWNSMMSVAGGWFFLMACEMFVLGNRDLRLPGLGSYLQTAANAGDTRAILWGVVTMIGVIVLLDQFVWRPVIAWAEKFKFEQVEATEAPHSRVLNFLRRSKLLNWIARVSLLPVFESVALYFARRHESEPPRGEARRTPSWAGQVLLLLLMGGLGLAVLKMISVLAGLRTPEARSIFLGAGATFFRVEFTLLLAALWTVPVGVAIGLRPRLSALAQPIAQVAASVPATALFPIVLLLLIRVGHGLGIGSMVLLLLGTQWYILFNVIAGASALPTDLKEVCEVFHYSKLERWRKLILPGIFPYLVTGFVTASGGAWNASIVAEYFHFRGETFSTTGLGAVISAATDAGNSPVLLAATILMASIVVTINRFLWRRLYSLASTKYKLES
ncbi:MAG TPA: ABC transporter permease subunit [Candidatus Limnocylindrales bacterium]|nr:ABC transporter permease subunit [Candidatus Limnocylindrales bacterium]